MFFLIKQGRKNCETKEGNTQKQKEEYFEKGPGFEKFYYILKLPGAIRLWNNLKNEQREKNLREKCQEWNGSVSREINVGARCNVPLPNTITI